MANVVALRMDDDILHRIDQLREKSTDRSTMIRELVERGYKDIIREKAVQLYREGKITFSEAAHRAELTLWEMQRVLVESGFRSDYSIEELEKEVALIGAKHFRKKK